MDFDVVRVDELDSELVGCVADSVEAASNPRQQISLSNQSNTEKRTCFF